MSDEEVVQAEIAKVQDAIIENLAKQGIKPDAPITLTGRELGIYLSNMTVKMSMQVGKQVLTEMQKTMKAQEDTIKEYVLNEVAPDLVPDFQKVAVLGRELARLDRELKTTRAELHAITERLDNVAD
jgi:hypothetical protein